MPGLPAPAFVLLFTPQARYPGLLLCCCVCCVSSKRRSVEEKKKARHGGSNHHPKLPRAGIYDSPGFQSLPISHTETTGGWDAVVRMQAEQGSPSESIALSSSDLEIGPHTTRSAGANAATPRLPHPACCGPEKQTELNSLIGMRVGVCGAGVCPFDRSIESIDWTFRLLGCRAVPVADETVRSKPTCHA
jgi:hypothetical protein